jgi:D-glycero-D-manno-heptose 1,7-bisphosphate phosphatase
MERLDAIFIDLDGTLIETLSGETFPQSILDWKFKNGILDALEKFKEKHLIIVSNQGGIEKGLISDVEFVTKIKKIISELDKRGYKKVSFSYCKTNEEGDFFRKPNPGMAYAFANNYQLDLTSCLMIGDASGNDSWSDSDLKFAEKTNMRYYDVKKFIEDFAY